MSEVFGDDFPDLTLPEAAQQVASVAVWDGLR